MCQVPLKAVDLVQWTEFISEILKLKIVERREKMPSNSMTVAVLFYLCLILILWILESHVFLPRGGLKQGTLIRLQEFQRITACCACEAVF